MKPRILIVEDEPGIADTLQYALRTDGFEPASCATGEEALARIAAEPPALVILDVGLPDASGFEIFKRIRATSEEASFRQKAFERKVALARVVVEAEHARLGPQLGELLRDGG